MRFALTLAPLALFLVIAPAVSRAQTPDRIAGTVDNSRRAALTGSVHPLAKPAYDRGRVDAAMSLPRIVLAFRPSAAQQADLDALLAQQQDRSSPNYHRWLTPEEFGSRFGLSQTDLAKVVAWLQGEGLAVVQIARSRTWVAFGGSAAQVAAAFQTELHRYDVNGEAHYANASAPSLPDAFAGLVAGIRGLDDFRPAPRALAKSNFTSSISGGHFIVPDDFATLYDLKPLYSAGVDGTGQKVAVMGQTDVAVNGSGTLTDIQTFRSLSGLPANNPQIVLVSGSKDPGMLASDIDEANLDLEWAGAVARNATIVYVNSTDVFNSLQYAVDQNLAPVISISYGGCEAVESGGVTMLQSLGQQANAQGITIVAATGDDGAADCDSGMIATQGLAVDIPASLPSVTAVGGTEFNDCASPASYWSASNNSDNGSVLSYIPEVAWNDSDGAPGVPCGAGATQLSAGGGGASMLFPKPAWQAIATGSGLTAANDLKRDVPDVSLGASADHDGFLICTESHGSGSFTPTCVNGYREANNDLSVFGGTSMGVPTFAGMVALINQQTGARQGNINYTLYALAAASTDAFHDVTSGNNMVPCQTGTPNCPSGTNAIGFNAGPGYDLATGLGSVDANNLVTEWTSVSPTSLGSGPSANSGSVPDFQLAISPQRLPISRGSSGMAQITVTPFNGFSGTVSLTCSVGSALTGATCLVTGSGNAQTLTVMVPAAASTGPGPWLQIFSGPTGALLLSAAAMLLLAALLLLSAPGAAARLGRVSAGVAVVCVLFAAGCGASQSSSSTSNGNGNGTGGGTPSSSSVSVLGTSGGVTHTAQIVVTVN
jgi:subtilase family serine protease